MKKINLPTIRTHRSVAFKIPDVIEGAESGEIRKLFSMDLGKSNQEISQARENGGKVVWATTTIEKNLEKIITSFLFPSASEAESNQKMFFSHNIVSSSCLGFSAKKGFVLSILNSDSIVSGKTKDQFSESLRKVMGYRNAFAHGDLIYDEDKGCFLTYWSGGSKEDVLDDAYWDTLVDWFARAHKTVNEIIEKLESKSSEPTDNPPVD